MTDDGEPERSETADFADCRFGAGAGRSSGIQRQRAEPVAGRSSPGYPGRSGEDIYPVRDGEDVYPVCDGQYGYAMHADEDGYPKRDVHSAYTDEDDYTVSG